MTIPLSHVPDDHDYTDVAERLLNEPEDSTAYLVGGLLGYWGRERLADTIEKFRALDARGDRPQRNPDVVVDLEFVGLVERRGAAPRAMFTYPEQRVGRDLLRARTVFSAAGPDQRSQASLAAIDPDERTVLLPWTPARVADGFYPDRLVADGWVDPRPKPEVLIELAEQILSRTPINQVTADLLAAAPPRFVTNGGPVGGRFTPDVDDAMVWVTELDGGYVAVQGPPGTGKTFLGAHLVYALIDAGQRVGITAMSHSAADNLLEAVHRVFAERGELDRLNAVKKTTTVPPRHHQLPGVTYATSNGQCTDDQYNLVVGTTWLFASAPVRGVGVDTLVVDEAGQLSLADAVVASLAATNVVLLGDPQQLAQVSMADHPGRAGSSVLDHVLLGEALVDPTRGVFLATTRRMHPEVTAYISQRFYDGQLEAHESCAVQHVAGEGVGLRYLEAAHVDCLTEAPAEADLITAEVTRLLGRAFTDAQGHARPLVERDFIVVAPYNDQVDLLRAALDAAGLADVPVGTVDRFQGREAPVVFYSMTTSSRSEIARGVEFLFSPNRLNVAISRARALAYLVATRDLLEAPAKGDRVGELVANVAEIVTRASARTPSRRSPRRRTTAPRTPAPTR